MARMCKSILKIENAIFRCDLEEGHEENHIEHGGINPPYTIEWGNICTNCNGTGIAFGMTDEAGVLLDCPICFGEGYTRK